jgi:hypothetical protein
MNLNLTKPRYPTPAARAIGWYVWGLRLADSELLGDPMWIGLDLVAGLDGITVVGLGTFAIFVQRGVGLREWGMLRIWAPQGNRENWQLRSRDGRTVVFPGHVAGTVVVTGGRVDVLAAAEIGGLPCAIQG